MARRKPVDVLPIVIRDGLTVQVHGLPHDLTLREAQKISRVILAMGEPEADRPERARELPL